MTTNEKRRELIKQIEADRGSKVITYFISDRRNANAQIGDDAVRPMYDHLRAIAHSDKIDMFLYSTGGQIEVPWRLVTMIREFSDEFNVLIPYKAMSAATLIALGADNIIMGRKGELGPIDPQVSFSRDQGGGTLVQENMSVEDIMSFIDFIRDKAGFKDETALASLMSGLTDKLSPWQLGSINRIHAHIREIAEKLLNARKTDPFDTTKIKLIIETLTERTYQHGHAIGRKEAKEIGLEISEPDEDLENLMWSLFEEYEELCQLKSPIDLNTFIPDDVDNRIEKLTIAAIESIDCAHHHVCELYMEKKRNMPAQMPINISLNLQVPQNVLQQLPQATQQLLQSLLQQAQLAVQQIVGEELKKQAPIARIDGRLQDGAWQAIDVWPQN